MQYYHILSLDGGGIRGVITATLLSRLEKACPGFLSKIDLVAGTSTGGILALALASGLQPERIIDLYIQTGPKIFKKDFWDDVRDLGQLIASDYENGELYQAVCDILGDQTLGQLPKKVLISSFELYAHHPKPGEKPCWKAKFFENFDHPGSDASEMVADVALRTSAAPTYFPIYQGFADGGVVANNPSMCALAQAMDKNTGKQRLGKIALLSVGTGSFPQTLDVQNSPWGLVQWAPHLVSLMLEGGSGLADYQCRQMLGSRYLRLNADMPQPYSLDSIQQIPLMQDLASQLDLTPAIQWVQKYVMG